MELQFVQNKIHIIRNQRIMLDYDLAELYGVETKLVGVEDSDCRSRRERAADKSSNTL